MMRRGQFSVLFTRFVLVQQNEHQDKYNEVFFFDRSKSLYLRINNNITDIYCMHNIDLFLGFFPLKKGAKQWQKKDPKIWTI